jgi:hypothetical protein
MPESWYDNVSEKKWLKLSRAVGYRCAPGPVDSRYVKILLTQYSESWDREQLEFW